MLSNLSSVYLTPAALLGLPLDSIMSTQGVMVMLLVAYAGAMWMFLKSAPKVYTVMVSDLNVARGLYEGLLNLPAAEVPLHYYYNYEQTLGTAGLDPFYLSGGTSLANQGRMSNPEGLWYQLRKNTQLHVVSGASLGQRNNQRHVCFDHNCMEYILMRVQLSGLQHKILQEKPLNFLVKDSDSQVIELVEIED